MRTYRDDQPIGWSFLFGYWFNLCWPGLRTRLTLNKYFTKCLLSWKTNWIDRRSNRFNGLKAFVLCWLINWETPFASLPIEWDDFFKSSYAALLTNKLTDRLTDGLSYLRKLWIGRFSRRLTDWSKHHGVNGRVTDRWAGREDECKTRLTDSLTLCINGWLDI